MSALPRSSAGLEANLSPRATDLHRQSMSRDGWKLGKLNTDTLNDWGQDPQRISSFASISTARSKSAKCFDEEFLDTKKESKKVAWAPKSKYNLSSSSTKFPRHGKIESIAELNRDSSMKGKQMKDFGRAEDHIYLTDLIKLRKVFKEADTKSGGTISLEEFMLIFDKLFALGGKNEDEILAFFNKIDYDCDGFINWDDFCTYMQLELQERGDVVLHSKMVEFQLPGEIITQNPHKDSICRISHLSDGMMVTCSQDGVVCFWSHDFKPRRTRKAEYGLIGKPKWVTDMALCNTLSKILLTTGDNEIQFYEMMNFEPYCQLRKLEAVPLRVDFWSNPSQHDECLILIGDNEGTVTVIKTSNIMEAFKYWKRGAKTENGMPTYSVDKLSSDRILGTSVYRWKLHSNWVTEVRYLPSLHNFVSSSCDSTFSMVMGTPSGCTPVEAMLQAPWPPPSTDRREDTTQEISARPRTYLAAKNRYPGDQRVFKVTKGVSTFDYCVKNSILVTGGLDQLIRLWNPYINSKPMAKLYGQNSPVFRVQVDSSNDRIYSIGNDNTIKVWHLLDHTCLFTVIPSLHKLSSAVECFYYNPQSFCLVLAAEQIALLKMTSSQGVRTDIIQTHLRPVTAISYSHCFNQVVTSCEGADVKVWEISSGKNVFEFSGDMGKDVGIRAMDVDMAGKRIVTGGDNGEIKLWNYSNGHCIRILDKGNSLETSDIKFITLNDNKYIIAAGWDRKIHLFPDVPGRHVHHVLKPIQGWSSASAHGHSEDILSIAVGLNNLMATSSFNGEVIVWSVVSCHMLSKLQPVYSSTLPELNEDRAVHKVLFLESRVDLAKSAATLVASGPCGKVHFWNIYNGRKPVGVFRACKSNSCISDMAVDETDSVLVTADTEGYVGVFSIKNYCTTLQSNDPPKKVALWRAHTQRISSVVLVDRWNTLLTGSADGAVRLWTLHGQYIGTFGQEQMWKLGDPSTYCHPLIPADILLDLSVMQDQSAPPIQAMSDADQAGVNPDPLKTEGEDEVDKAGKTLESKETLTVTELIMEEEDELLKSHISMEVPSYGSSGVGKRAHSAVKKDETKAKAVYGTLPYQPLDDEIQPEAQTLRQLTAMYTN